MTKKQKKRRPWRTRKRSYRRKKAGLSIINTATFIGAEIQALAPTINHARSGASLEDIAKSFAQEHVFVWTGYNPELFGGGQGHFDLGRFTTTWTPIIIGAFASKLLGRYVNPTIKKLPLVGNKLRL